MTKLAKIIFLTTAALIMLSILFPPFFYVGDIQTNSEVRTVISKSGWGFLFFMNKINYKTGSESATILRYIIRFDILSLEIFGIVVLGGAAFLLSKKR